MLFFVKQSYIILFIAGYVSPVVAYAILLTLPRNHCPYILTPDTAPETPSCFLYRKKYRLSKVLIKLPGNNSVLRSLHPLFRLKLYKKKSGTLSPDYISTIKSLELPLLMYGCIY